MLTVIKQLAREYKDNLQALYGDELVELILFGSYARGDFHDESDIDFAIVLKNPGIRPSSEIFKISPIGTKLELKYGLMLSSLPVSFEKKQKSMQGVYQEIRKDGIVI